MPYACIHTHTVFCDGYDDIETFCLAAKEKGLAAIGFSAHAPITSKTGIQSGWNLSDEKLDEYIEAVKAAKKRWEGILPVYLGLEVDFISGLMGPADKDYLEMDLDYIIGSVHFVFPPKGKPFTVDDPGENVLRGIKEGFGGDSMGMVEAYLNSEEAMIHAGGFDLLGHPDLVKVNKSGLKERGCELTLEDDDFYRNKISNLARLMAGTGVPSELNTGGLNRGRIKECYPSPFFLKLFREQNVPMVINADAHRAKDLDGHYTEAEEALLCAGYTETLIFQGRENGRPLWKSVKLPAG
jgi:histidinol-phosphatase (PHP family)